MATLGTEESGLYRVGAVMGGGGGGGGGGPRGVGGGGGGVVGVQHD